MGVIFSQLLFDFGILAYHQLVPPVIKNENYSNFKDNVTHSFAGHLVSAGGHFCYFVLFNGYLLSTIDDVIPTR